MKCSVLALVALVASTQAFAFIAPMARTTSRVSFMLHAHKACPAALHPLVERISAVAMALVLSFARLLLAIATICHKTSRACVHARL
jgi:hypothetical protein